MYKHTYIYVNIQVANCSSPSIDSSSTTSEIGAEFQHFNNFNSRIDWQLCNLIFRGCLTVAGFTHRVTVLVLLSKNLFTFVRLKVPYKVAFLWFMLFINKSPLLEVNIKFSSRASRFHINWNKFFKYVHIWIWIITKEQKVEQ